LGLETALSVVQHTLVDTGFIGWPDVARILSSTPARIGQLAGYNAPLAVGSPAHLTLVDPSAQHHGEMRYTASSNNPYRGRALPGRVLHTFYAGVATVIDGDVVAPDALGVGG